MRALAPLFAILASCATIFAAMVRLWWSKPRITPGPKTYGDGGQLIRDDTRVQEAKAPSWLQTTAKWWLRIVVFGLTLGALIVVITVIVRIINISN